MRGWNIAGCNERVRAGKHVGKVATSGGHSVTLASFHGDTNGLLTPPMLEKLMENLPAQRLIFGLDANTYEKESKVQRLSVVCNECRS